MRKVLIILFAIGAACFAGAEVIYDYTGQGAVFDGTNWDNYVEDGGLAHNNIHSITIDSDGTKWIGTFWGLNKFDGTDFPLSMGVGITIYINLNL